MSAKQEKKFGTYLRQRRLHRRTFLKGLMGGTAIAVGLPVLDCMLNQSGTALAAGTPLPKRFGVFTWGCGVGTGNWVPSQTGSDFGLSTTLQPFAPIQDYLTVISGLRHRGSSPGHIPARGISLSSSHDLTINQSELTGTYRGHKHPEPSVDVLVKEAFQGQTLFNSLEVGICKKGPYSGKSSWERGGSTYNGCELNPQALFDRVFTGGVPMSGGNVTGGMSANDFNFQKSILDAVRADASQLKSELGSADKMRMEQHLTAIRSLEVRLQDRWDLQSTDPTCTLPDRPSTSSYGDGGSSEQKEAKSDAMSEILAVALACDMTRVFSYEWSANQSGAVYWELGSSGEHHDDHSHSNSVMVQTIAQFIMQHGLVKLAQKLKAMPEGDGNVLDNTLIFATSEHSNANAHNYADHPILLVGKAGGSIQGNNHYRHPNPSDNYDAPNALLTGVRAVGVELESLGQASQNRNTTSDLLSVL